MPDLVDSPVEIVEHAFVAVGDAETFELAAVNGRVRREGVQESVQYWATMREVGMRAKGSQVVVKTSEPTRNYCINTAPQV